MLLGFATCLLFAQDEVFQKPEFITIDKSLEEQAIQNSKPFKRKQWYLQQRLDEHGNVPNIEKNNFEAFNKYKRAHPEIDQNRNAHGSWNFLGPYTTSNGGFQGRVNSIDIHPTNESIIYLCTPNGGIWKTTDAGSTWAPLTDHLVLNSFCDLEISTTNPNIIYALSGDGDPAVNPNQFHSGAEVTSVGVFKSSDAGNTWVKASQTLPNDLIPLKLLMHPTNSNIQFLACEDGIYKTTDGWQSATLVHSTNTYDIEFKPGDPSIMYSSGSNIYRSTTSGDSWTIVVDNDFDLLPQASRIELAITPDYPTYVAAIAGNWFQGSKGVYVS
jgi:hypothetical protein